MSRPSPSLRQESSAFITSFNPSKAWWKSACIYQIYPISFYDSNGDGIGDLPGILAKLDYLKDLGVDVIWLSPIYKSPLADMGYDIADYEDIDPRFGTLEDWDRLVEGVHKRGMKLLMDLVVNHTSDEHAWFKESRSSKTNPKRDWYIWRPPRYDEHGNRLPPNNWESIFQGSAWEYDEATDEYYLHLFVKEQPDLNWENPDVREAVYRMMRFWLDRGCDGFRMDVINMISKVPGLPDAPVLEPMKEFQAASLFYANGPRVHEFLKEMNEKVLSRYDVMTVGETPCTHNPQEIAEYVLPQNRELNMVFQFELMDLDLGVALRAHAQAVAARGHEALRRQVADAYARAGLLEHALHREPRPGALRVALRRRLGPLARAVGEAARDAPDDAERDALRVPGRGNRHEELPASVGHRGVQGRRDDQLLQRGTFAAHEGRGHAERRHGRRYRRLPEEGPRPRANASAVERGSTRGLHDGHAVDARERRLRRGLERRGRSARRRQRLGVLAARDRAAQAAGRARVRRLPDAAAGPRAGLRVHALAARHHRACRPQLQRQGRDGAGRPAVRRRAQAQARAHELLRRRGDAAAGARHHASWLRGPDLHVESGALRCLCPSDSRTLSYTLLMFQV
ncbi:glycoside hydrolase family 13 protein [Phanerochaete sordida]|uniref:Glycoside hydrolase family 13 protein n=1 Tax=Phanerochaete sordida TaxID=48140 RepID=A0A9P3GRY7_9APHY|nr:glycoside hydrolase family 13 protein [Phanerochaete sordida]